MGEKESVTLQREITKAEIDHAKNSPLDCKCETCNLWDFLEQHPFWEHPTSVDEKYESRDTNQT